MESSAEDPIVNDENKKERRRLLDKLKEESSNPSKFVKASSDIINRPVATLIPVLVVGLAVPMLVIGILYNDECKIQKYIPIWLIVTGTFGTISGLTKVIVNILFCLKKRNTSGRSCLGTCAFCIHFGIFLIVNFIICWVIAGSVWIYGSFSNVKYEPTDGQNYCNRVLYIFSFCAITATYILVVLPYILFICFACLCIYCCCIGPNLRK